MLVTLLAWTYITLLCWTYGNSFMQLLGKSADTRMYLHFSITCLIGLAFLSVIGSAVSLFIGLNDIYLHATLFSIALILISRTPAEAYKRFGNNLKAYSFQPLILLLVSSMIILIMSIWHIKHPDTVEYHSAIIESIKDKKVEKGIALQNLRYGLQSNWFVGCALFSFDFLTLNSLTFLNSVLLLWIICFVTDQIQKKSFTSGKEKDLFNSFLWILFLLFAFWDYTQIRLTATSASPDFPTAVYLLLIGYIYLNKPLNKEYIALLCFLISFTFTLKLFSFPFLIILIHLGYLTIRKYPSLILSIVSILLITCTPFLVRNHFSSGHIFYPSAFPLIGKPDWRVPITDIQYLHAYIKAYARTASSEDPLVVQKVATASLKDWLPTWWNLRSISQKTIVLFTLTSLFLNLAYFNKLLCSNDFKHKVLYATSVLGLICLFVLAPDPRFSIAFFIFLGYITLSTFAKLYLLNVLQKKTIVISLAFLSIALIAYFIYRMVYYFDFINFIFPYSISNL